MRSSVHPVRLVSILGLVVLAGCSGGAGRPTAEPLEIETVSTGAALVVHRAYTASFDALEAALAADDLLVAESTLRRLEQRLAVDRATAPTMAQAKARDDDVAARTLSGELPSAENVEAATKMAEGFGRVIAGRRRMAAIELELELDRRPGTEVVDVYLLARSSWPSQLVLEPGAGRLEVLRASLEPRTGGERREARIRALEGGTRLEIPANGSVRELLTEVPVEVPVGAIATRMETKVTFNGGTVSDREASYPMREEDLPRTRRVDLAGWVPTSLVEPIELAELVERGGAPLAAMLERAVRISPSRRDETLDRLGKVVRTLPVDAFHSIVPALRWIVGTNEFGRDEKRWRDWLIERYEARAAAGRAIGG